MSGGEGLPIYVVAPTGRDSALVRDILCQNGVTCIPFGTVHELCNSISESTGAVVLTEEALRDGAVAELEDALAKQPTWSDIGVIILTSNSNRVQSAIARALQKRGPRSVVLIDRPVRLVTLLSTIESALQARRRQYELRDYLEERVRNEERLRHTQKLESVGILAGGIAHDFNNILTGVLGNASLALECVPKDSPVREMLESVVSASERAAHLTKQLLAYAGKGKFLIESLDLSQQVREIMSLLESSVPRSVQLRLELDDGLPLIEADPAQLQQIVMNLVINAAEAIPERTQGTVVISTGVEPVDEAYLRSTDLHAEITPGRYVALEVRDTGEGMTEDTIARIFDPFFTTKFTGRGLGLSAVLGIVRGHKAGLRIESVPGRGSSFHVLFPAVEERKIAPEPGRDGETSVEGSGMVLVIDDEEIVRRTAKAALERFGYMVLLAANGREGVEIFRAIAERVSAVLLDMTMPVMSGEETFERLRAIRADATVILSSGHSEAEAVRRFAGKGLAGFVQKPYTSIELARAIRRVLRPAVRESAV
jgi:signal transduction histidine kinase/CheY-like chemotaxis protein